MRPQPVWILLGLLVATVFVVRGLILRWRQSKVLRELARTRRLSYSVEDLIGLHDRYYSLDMIRIGHSRSAAHVLYGTTDAGLLTMFRYSYELGFGAQRAVRTQWMAVLETAGVHDHWQAGPSTGHGSESRPMTARHAATLQALSDAGLEKALAAFPADANVEARGHLLAVTVPASADQQQPAQLLGAIMRLAPLAVAAAGRAATA